MIYQILGISCGWRTLVVALQQWQQVMATQSTPAAREGSVIIPRPDRGLHVTSARAGTIVSVSEYATRRQKQFILRAMPAYTTRRLFSTCSSVLPPPHRHFPDFQCVRLLMTPTFSVLRSCARPLQGSFAQNLGYEQNISAPK